MFLLRSEKSLKEVFANCKKLNQRPAHEVEGVPVLVEYGGVVWTRGHWQNHLPLLLGLIIIIIIIIIIITIIIIIIIIIIGRTTSP